MARLDLSLDAEELACLYYLSRYPDAEPGRCSAVVLDRLLARGMVEQVRLLSLPVLGQTVRYRITARGRAALAAAGRGE